MILTPVYYSALFFSLLSIQAIVLAILIVKIRRSDQIGLADGGNKDLLRHMRVQANFLEYFMPFAALFLVYELNQGREDILIGAGSLFLLARIIHAMGFLKSGGYSFGRFYGTGISWLVILFLAGANLYQLV